jgi:hypothetical protein
MAITIFAFLHCLASALFGRTHHTYVAIDRRLAREPLQRLDFCSRAIPHAVMAQQ